MGCGKSTVGKSLAASKNLTFIDLDQYIENQANKSIGKLFKEEGELAFRKRERNALMNILERNEAAVIALGGGTPCYFDNMEKISSSQHHSFYLNASIPVLVERLKVEKAQRPLIAHLESEEDLTEFIGKHLFERSSYYRKAKHTLDINHKTPQEVVNELLLNLG